jgi:DNA-directed RNA polymerase I, II, and III subunit RPABC1
MVTKTPVEEAQIDIFKSKLVPESRILSQEEKKGLLDKYDIGAGQLPKISVSDSVSKLLNAKHGDVIEFKRKTITAGLSKYYRIVVGGAA